MTTVTVRDARPDDGPGLRAIFRRASLANTGDRDALLAHPEALEWHGPPGPPARCRVAVDGQDDAVGFATTRPDGRALELVDLFVEPDLMRTGVATALVADAAANARELGASRIDVDGNPHALAFYRAAGFVEVGTVITEFGTGHRLTLVLS